ncbi:hypothetical protein BX616_002761 [Lobosporangium transversale]|uniref:Uncharacterized protein n=1 Tax=Lobosporangium transversale TaxID=64571 RepID=A0A1Y2GDN0_9FUNG|nr:hypothetical protein BCR41DRAFT_373766 [Lobosporangium transversale]KAF9916801.1 hypothetical protein BX616_002761 [Lobosporangium transversale]ORZ06977.1 hypothetical protein BCR41DRAFT_373766 [Lobosporangium transversale]|eukprot:XP_021877773.1 hypothetical protein BCR41DRAFT_373766 [Lobosporangium transversale]
MSTPSIHQVIEMMITVVDCIARCEDDLSYHIKLSKKVESGRFSSIDYQELMTERINMGLILPTGEFGAGSTYVDRVMKMIKQVILAKQNLVKLYKEQYALLDMRLKALKGEMVRNTPKRYEKSFH